MIKILSRFKRKLKGQLAEAARNHEEFLQRLQELRTLATQQLSDLQNLREREMGLGLAADLPRPPLAVSAVSEVDAEEVCSICLSEFDQPVITDHCQHHFCSACISQWYDGGHDRCPLCRRGLGRLAADNNAT